MPLFDRSQQNVSNLEKRKVYEDFYLIQCPLACKLEQKVINFDSNRYYSYSLQPFQTSEPRPSLVDSTQYWPSIYSSRNRNTSTFFSAIDSRQHEEHDTDTTSFYDDPFYTFP